MWRAMDLILWEEFEELFHALVLNSLSEALEPDESGTAGTVGALGLVSSLQDSGVIFWGDNVRSLSFVTRTNLAEINQRGRKALSRCHAPPVQRIVECCVYSRMLLRPGDMTTLLNLEGDAYVTPLAEVLKNLTRHGTTAYFKRSWPKDPSAVDRAIASQFSSERHFHRKRANDAFFFSFLSGDSFGCVYSFAEHRVISSCNGPLLKLPHIFFLVYFGRRFRLVSALVPVVPVKKGGNFPMG
jgi:hypothetical protein